MEFVLLQRLFERDDPPSMALLKNDSRGLSIVLTCESRVSVEVTFRSYVAYEVRDQVDSLMDADEASLYAEGIFNVLNGRYLAYIRAGSVFTRHNAKQYTIFTDEEQIDIVAYDDPIVEMKSP